MTTHEEELSALTATVEAIREIIELPDEDKAALDASLKLPTWLDDQQRAAWTETATRFPELGALMTGGDPDNVRRGDIGKAAHVLIAGYIAALIMRCFAAHHCGHADLGIVPLYAFAAARVLTCEHCMPNYFGVMAARDARRDSDTECDFCLKRDVTSFFPTSANYGPAMIYADVCDDCAALVNA